MYSVGNMNEEKEYLSKEKFDALTEELQFLKTKRRKENAEKLEFAKSLGDLSENAEYHEARQDQAATEDRILTLESILSHAEIITESKHKTDKVRVGSTVVIEKGGKKLTYQIVGPEEVNTTAGKISNKSPIGEALLGKSKGDSVSYTTPAGSASCKIVDIA